MRCHPIQSSSVLVRSATLLSHMLFQSGPRTFRQFGRLGVFPGIGVIHPTAIAGEQAGFTLDQMIELLNSGLSVVALLYLITWRLGRLQSSFESFPVWVGSRNLALPRGSRDDLS
jgi:hypothetical protein